MSPLCPFFFFSNETMNDQRWVVCISRSILKDNSKTENVDNKGHDDRKKKGESTKEKSRGWWTVIC